MNQEKFGIFIRELRNELKMTQQTLADKIGVSDRAISKWENGRGMPDISFLIPLSKALNVTVLELLNGEKSDDYDNAAIKLVKQNTMKIKFWKWWVLGISNILLIFMSIIIVYGYIIPSTNKNIVVINSESMSPMFDLYDVIVYDSVSIDKVNINDLVVYNFEDKNGNIYDFEVVHSVNDIINENNEIKLITRGYNNIKVDTTYVTKDNYLGIYNHKISKIGSFFIRNNFKHLPLVLMFLILGIFSVVYLDIYEIIKLYNKRY